MRPRPHSLQFVEGVSGRGPVVSSVRVIVGIVGADLIVVVVVDRHQIFEGSFIIVHAVHSQAGSTTRILSGNNHISIVVTHHPDPVDDVHVQVMSHLHETMVCIIFVVAYGIQNCRVSRRFAGTHLVAAEVRVDHPIHAD